MGDDEILRIVGERIKRLLARVELGLQGQHVLERRTTVLANVAKWQIAAIHPKYDKWA